ncbi:MAG: hypothetical protein ACRD82_06470 [Blastocatellia bacterium]
MIAQATTKISALEAQATAGLFLSDHLPAYFRAGEPAYDQTSSSWCVPVLLDYGYANPFGEVGQVVINAFAAKVISHTTLTEMQELGRKLYQQFSEDCAAAFAANENASVVTDTTEAAVPEIPAIDIIAAANHFLFDHLPDRLTAGEPRFNAQANAWLVPVLLAYPRIGSVGQIGEIVVSGQTKAVISHTPVDEILQNARIVYDQQREKIEAVVF